VARALEVVGLLLLLKADAAILQIRFEHRTKKFLQRFEVTHTDLALPPIPTHWHHVTSAKKTSPDAPHAVELHSCKHPPLLGKPIGKVSPCHSEQLCRSSGTSTKILGEHRPQQCHDWPFSRQDFLWCGPIKHNLCVIMPNLLQAMEIGIL
jgi:hypothetical protein